MSALRAAIEIPPTVDTVVRQMIYDVVKASYPGVQIQVITVQDLPEDQQYSVVASRAVHRGICTLVESVLAGDYDLVSGTSERIRAVRDDPEARTVARILGRKG